MPNVASISLLSILFFFIAPSGFTNVYLQFLNNVIFIKTTVLLHQSYMVFSDFLSVIYLRFEYIIEVLIYGSPAYVLYSTQKWDHMIQNVMEWSKIISL